MIIGAPGRSTLSLDQNKKPSQVRVPRVANPATTQVLLRDIMATSGPLPTVCREISRGSDTSSKIVRSSADSEISDGDCGNNSLSLRGLLSRLFCR